ncbi:MAG TPA: sialidase family protein [Polyangia bacterium]|nr:sialidase family protein [Polyangia bacterium]
MRTALLVVGARLAQAALILVLVGPGCGPGAGGGNETGTGGHAGSGGSADGGSAAGGLGGSAAGAATGGQIGSGGTGAGGDGAATGGTGGMAGQASGLAGTGGTSGSTGAGGGAIDTSGAPFTVKAGLFDQTKPDDLGLAAPVGLETFTIFSPTAATDHYSNAVALVAFKGWLYAQWQSSPTDEDTPDTWTAYSRSQDGETWTAPMTLAAKASDGERTSGGWWVAGDTLVAYINVYPTALTPRGGYTEYVTSTDGLTWSAPRPLPMADGTTLTGVFEQDPHALPGGRILNAAHFQPGLTCAPCYTDDPSGVAGWIRAPFHNLSVTTTSSRELEPSSYLRADGAVVMIFRDQSSTFYKLAAVSGDRGATWTTPVLTNMPDSRAKQSAGNLPDGAAYFASNPVTNKTRIPLAVTLSRDGRLFDKAFVLRKGGADLQPQRYTGTAKTLGYNYPKSMVANGYLYVGYATNKEDVQVSRVRVGDLGY